VVVLGEDSAQVQEGYKASAGHLSPPRTLLEAPGKDTVLQPWQAQGRPEGPALQIPAPDSPSFSQPRHLGGKEGKELFSFFTYAKLSNHNLLYLLL